MNTHALLADQVVVVTGGAGGQGRAHAVTAARHGADVALLDRLPVEHDAYTSTIAEVEALGKRCIAVSCDATKQWDIDQAVTRVVSALGRIDALIVNAGVHRGGLFWEMSEEDWRFVFDVNLDGAWKTAKAVAPHMIARGSGSIVFISSVDAFDPEVESTAYGVSKAGVLALTKYAAYELAEYGVRCNAIAPGFIDSPMVNTQTWYDLLNGGGPGSGSRDDLIAYGHAFTAMGDTSLLRGEDVANTAVYLNSALAEHVTGITVPVDAGHLLVSRINQHPVITDAR